MDELALPVITAILGIISLCSLSYIFYLKYVARPTKEKFAFYSVGAIITLSIFAITSAFYQTPWVAISKILEHFMGIHFEISQDAPTLPEKLLIFTFIGIISYIILSFLIIGRGYKYPLINMNSKNVMMTFHFCLRAGKN